MTDAELLIQVEIMLEEGSELLVPVSRWENQQHMTGRYVRESIYLMKYKGENRYFRTVEISAKSIPDFTEKFETQVTEVVPTTRTETIYVPKPKGD